jgi:hypothetical protein
MKFPMILTHRSNPHAQIVVANADQLAEAPEDFLPPASAAPTFAAAAIPGVNLDTAEDAERRQSLGEAVDEFTAHVQAEETRLAAARAQLDADRAALDEQIEALARDRADFEAQRASTTAGTGETAGETGTASATAEGAATGDSAAAPVAPAKRTRTAKEGA